MTRTQRVVTATGALVVAVLTVVVLTRGGTPSQGPIGRLLDAIGGAVSEAEVRVARSLRGPGRRAALEWVAPYAESPAALRTPKEVLLGVYDSGIPATLDGVLAVEHALGVPLPLIHLYSAWGDRPDQQFPRRLVVAISELGSIPVVTWEPWLSVFEERLHPQLRAPAVRDKDGLADVARGAYDFYLDRWAAEAADFGRPLIVRFAHEMNDAYRGDPTTTAPRTTSRHGGTSLIGSAARAPTTCCGPGALTWASTAGRSTIPATRSWTG